MNSISVIIIGGGPSGMMAAISSKIHHPQHQVILLERNKELGVKLKLTGGGRCNVTANVSTQAIIESTPKNGKFLYSSIANFSPSDIQSFFINEGCPLKIEDHNRVFPKSNKAIDIINTLKRKLEILGVDIKLGTKVEEIDFQKQIIKTNITYYNYDSLIIATGGLTYPLTGSDGIGYDFARGLGHSITALLPGEVPLVSNDKVIQDKVLQGLSFSDIRIDILDKNKVKKSIIHDLIFTHFGISGPGALRASFYVQELLKHNALVNLNIDFLPNISRQELEQYKGEELIAFILGKGIPKRLVNYLIQINHLMQIKQFPLTIYSTRGFSQAFVTNGGVSIKEIDPKTMKSKIDPSVSFCGEVLDISSFTGGYNITSAFATGYTAGKYVLNNN